MFLTFVTQRKRRKELLFCDALMAYEENKKLSYIESNLCGGHGHYLCL